MAFFGMVGTSPSLPRWRANRGQPLEVGNAVFVRARSSPMAGQAGTLAEICPGDPYGPYLVQFSNGLRFRYLRSELALTCNTDSAVKNR